MATHSKPQYSAKDIVKLMKFYGANTIFDLIAAQEEHVKRLQEKLPKENVRASHKVREG